MTFRGEVLPVGALIDVAGSGADTVTTSDVGIRHTAAQNAAACRPLLADGPDTGWRFGVLQTLDDYSSTLRRGGVGLAAEVFADEPPATGSAGVDAALAALAEYLAHRDGWRPPAWALDPSRRVDVWYPAVPTIFRPDANRESPEPFRRRGILITARSLERA